MDVPYCGSEEPLFAAAATTVFVKKSPLSEKSSQLKKIFKSKFSLLEP